VEYYITICQNQIFVSLLTEKEKELIILSLQEALSLVDNIRAS